MKQYLLSVYQPERDPARTGRLGEDHAGSRQAQSGDEGGRCMGLFGGLNHPSTATVLRLDGGEILEHRWQFAEGKEYLGDFTIINAVDLDAALDWGRKLAHVVPLPIEVRPFADGR
jgi:hypothetical protein